jgi:hypothetical protein
VKEDGTLSGCSSIDAMLDGAADRAHHPLALTAPDYLPSPFCIKDGR